MEIGLEIILLTFPNTKTDSERGEHEADNGDEDGERGAETEALEDSGEAVPVHGWVPESVEGGELIELGGGARVVVGRDLTTKHCYNDNRFLPVLPRSEGREELYLMLATLRSYVVP